MDVFSTDAKIFTGYEQAVVENRVYRGSRKFYVSHFPVFPAVGWRILGTRQTMHCLFFGEIGKTGKFTL